MATLSAAKVTFKDKISASMWHRSKTIAPKPWQDAQEMLPSSTRIVFIAPATWLLRSIRPRSHSTAHITKKNARCQLL